jgi:hypothetical protein
MNYERIVQLLKSCQLVSDTGSRTRVKAVKEPYPDR